MSSVQKLDAWAAKFVQTYPLTVLKDAVIGVDATYYLEQRLNESKEEPLKAALGGIPFLLRSSVEDDLIDAKEAGVKFIFIFNGLDYVNKSPAPSVHPASLKAHRDGWEHYYAGDASAPVQDFGSAKYPMELVYRYLRQILQENGVEYIVAPYSAVAQLSYLLHAPDQHIDAVVSSTEAFLFDVPKIILGLNHANKSFAWLSKSTCEERLGKISNETFRDAQLLLGSSFLPTFPPLERSLPNKSSITDALNYLNGAGRSVLNLCNQYRDDQVVQGLDYADRYKKAIMTIKHHVILMADGNVEPLDFDHAPGDVHEFVGQRLPDELYFYLSRGLQGSQIPNWLTTGEIDLTLPGGVLDSEPFKRLIIEQLNQLRQEALKIVSESLTFYYSTRPVELKTFDDRDTSQFKIELKGVPPLRAKASEWKVTEKLLPSGSASILACLNALKTKSVAQQTITKGKTEHPALASQKEILANVYWRFLQIRGYISDKHELTSHGIMLDAVLSAMEDSDSDAELGIIAIELLRFGQLNTSSISGTPVPPQDKDFKHRSYVNLISKIACLGRLEHEQVGYVGPLDRQLLSFAWMITAVRESLRNLIESVLVSMLLNGDVDRNRTDWEEIPQKLPFIFDNGAALGVAAKTYLDSLRDKDITADLKTQIKSGADKYAWFPKVKDLGHNLETAFRLFDAVNAGVQAVSKESRDARTFADASEWLKSRR